jgi:hypothetical protein
MRSLAARLLRWVDETFFELARQFRWSYLPPLMVYLAAGVSGLTGIVGAFFVKDYLGLSASFLAGLAFWSGLPWALKMPLGHLVDLIWRWKSWLVYLGAGLIATSIGIMYGLIAHRDALTPIMSVEAWFVLSTLLSPIGYVIQDVVADAMTAEAVPPSDQRGNPYSEDAIKQMHTTMQTLGRLAVIGGTVLVAALNIYMFDDVEYLSESQKVQVYAEIHLMALAIPVISILGVILGDALQERRARHLARQGIDATGMQGASPGLGEVTKPNWWILGGSLVFVTFTLFMGLGDVPFAQELIFVGSLAILIFLMQRLLLEIEPDLRRAIVGTAVIIFFFRATPLPGAGQTWFEIDILGFDQQFLSVLSLLISVLTLGGIILLRPLMANRSIAYVVIVLTVAGAVLSLPNIGLYYGIQNWTGRLTNGVIDARSIAILDTALESPLAQAAMIPMLAWIAKNAPPHLKATFFAVMASFTNLALSASSLGTKYLTEIFVVTRQIQDRTTGIITVPADYSKLGVLLIVVAVIGLVIPLAAVVLIQNSRFRTNE